MAERQKTSDVEIVLVWERPEPVRQPTPSPLSRDRIVRTAISIADKEGLASVSVRNVANALKAGPMRLYGYLTTKEEMLELMVDAVYGEMVAEGPIPSDWQAALRSIAHRTRRAARAHNWFSDLLGGRPHMGPNALAHHEMSLAALHGQPGFEEIDMVMQAVRTVNAYTIGAIRGEESELRSEKESGMDEPAWQKATWPYLQRMIATGRYPTIAKVVQDATHPPNEAVFDRGLDCVLAGIAAVLKQ